MEIKQIVRAFLYLTCFLALLTVFSNPGHSQVRDLEPETNPRSGEPVVSELLVKVQDAPSKEAYLADMARNLIFLQKGEPFSVEKLEKSINALKLCKKFKEINVDSKDEPEKIAIIFTLKPFQHIRDIKTDGAFPLFEREILNAMTIYTGDAFVRDKLPKQEKLINELFLREGFILPKSEVTAQQDPETGYYVIYVKIEKGSYYDLKNLDIRENRVFSDARLKLRMKTWVSSLLPRGAGRFIEQDLRKDIKNLTEYYRKKGYPEVAIDFKVEKDPGTKRASVVVTVSEGPEYKADFVGNEEFWDFTLKKDLVFFKEGNKKDAGIRKSIRAIKNRYKNAGYLEAEVNLEETKKNENIRMLRFVITEGPCSIVESIRISGNHSFDEEKIKKQILTRLPGFLNKGAFVPEILDEDIIAIESFYLRQGYMETRVKKDVRQSEDKKQVAVGLEIEEGVRTVVSSAKITKTEIVSEKDAHDSIILKQGKPFQEHLIKKDENALSSLVSEKGHPHVRVRGDVSFSKDHSEANMTYDIKEGPHVKMGEIYYSGNFRTKEKILENETEVEPGEPFSLARLLETQRNIRNLDVSDSVQFKAIGLKERAESVSLFVDMEEKKPYFVEIGIGYDTEKSFYAHAKAGDHNLFGTNKDAWLGGEISEIGYRCDLGITEPRLFGTRISATLDLYSEQREEYNQDFGTRTYGASLGFNRKWLKHVTTGLNFSFNRIEQFERDSGGSAAKNFDASEFEPRNTLVTTPSVSYDTRDSFVRPKKGIYSSLSVDISKGLENSLDNYFKYQFDSRAYWTPFKRLTLACYGRIGYIDPFDSEGNVPKGEIFFLGGTSDVRGFSENMLRFDPDMKSQGGRSAISGSMEARIDLGLNFELTGFYDTGKVGNVFGEDDSGEFRSAVGGGIRYITPIGPIGFLYGYKLDPKEGESKGRLHFALGYTF